MQVTELNKKEEILNTATALFMKNGVQSVTMDELAIELQMSKKTIYKFFSDKRSLVDGCMKSHFGKHQTAVRGILAKNLNVIDEMFAIGEFVNVELRAVNPLVFADLNRFYPEAFRSFLRFKNDFILEVIRQNLNRGVVDQWYRGTLNIEVVARLYAGMTDLIFDDENFPSTAYDKPSLYLELFSYHLHGIATPRGIEYFDKTCDANIFK